MRMAVVVVAIAIGAAGCTAHASTRALPYYDSADLTPHWSPVAHRIADFAMTSQAGSTVTGASLRGRVLVVNFMFTQCPLICPPVMSNLKRVQTAIAGLPHTSLVSFSVTPDFDTPAVLARYGADRGIDPARWLLLTGPLGEISSLAHSSFFAVDDRAAPGTLLHSEKVLLVDRDGHLRGVYNGTLPHEIDKLIEDVKLLAGS